MQYENFSRHLRKKYATCVHVADQLVDQLKHVNLSPTSRQELNQKNMIKAQQEISFPLISYLNQFECQKSKPSENNHQEFEPYFNECILAAERIKNNRYSQRDRQICYENVILTQKLERIKRQSRKKDYQNHCQLLLAKVNCAQDSVQSISMKPSESSNETSFSEENTHRSVLSDKNESETSAPSDNEDDQATAADVDASMELSNPRSFPSRKQRNVCQNNRNFNCAQSKSIKCNNDYSMNNPKQRLDETEDNRIYQHLSNLDMMMIRNAIPLSTSQSSRHFSICILPHLDSTMEKSMNNHWKVLSNDRKYAFKKEILYA